MRTFLSLADVDNRAAAGSEPPPQSVSKEQRSGTGFSPGFSSFLDFSRWLAAFVVFIGHLRGVIFIGYPDLPSGERSYLVGALYFLSGFGLSSVVVFFVLSGFLVGGIGITKVKSGRFDTLNYSIDRFVRLFIVYVPALVLTLILDFIGNRFFTDTGLWNCGSALMCEHFSDFTKLLSLKTFLMNLFMLQSFYSPYFGSAKPLWSLSYEFWFYVEFGLLAAALLHGRALRGRLAIVAIIVAAFLGFRFLALLGVWFIGVAVSLYAGDKLRNPLLSIVAFVLSSFAMRRFGALEAASDLKEYLLIYMNALSFAWVIISVKDLPLTIFSRFASLNKFFADFSYTVYLIHFPLMLFVVGVIAHFFNITQIITGFMPTSPVGLKLYFSTLILVLSLCRLFAQCTERHTDNIRAELKGRLRPLLGMGNSVAGKLGGK